MGIAILSLNGKLQLSVDKNALNEILMKSNTERNMDDISGILHHLMTTSLLESQNRIDVFETAFLFCNDASLSCLCLFILLLTRAKNYHPQILMIFTTNYLH